MLFSLELERVSICEYLCLHFFWLCYSCMKCIIVLYIDSVVIQLPLEKTKVQVNYHHVTRWVIFLGFRLPVQWWILNVRKVARKGREEPSGAYIFKHACLAPREKEQGKAAIFTEDGNDVCLCCFLVVVMFVVLVVFACLFCLRIFRDINASQVIQDCASTSVCMRCLEKLISLLLSAPGPTAPFERLTQYSSPSRQLAFSCPEAIGNYYQKPWLKTPCQQKTSPEQRRLW